MMEKNDRRNDVCLKANEATIYYYMYHSQSRAEVAGSPDEMRFEEWEGAGGKRVQIEWEEEGGARGRVEELEYRGVE